MPSQNSAGFSGANPIQHFCEFHSPRFFGSLGFAKRSNNFKFFFGGKFSQFRNLGFNASDLSFFTFSTFSSINYVFHSFVVKKLIKKFLLPFIDKSFSFSPKKPFQILCERRVSRREVELSFLQNSNWRCILEIARTKFCSRPASRDSEWAGGQNERRSREHSKLPKNLKTNRLEPYFGRAKEIFSSIFSKKRLNGRFLTFNATHVMIAGKSRHC